MDGRASPQHDLVVQTAVDSCRCMLGCMLLGWGGGRTGICQRLQTLTRLLQTHSRRGSSSAYDFCFCHQTQLHEAMVLVPIPSARHVLHVAHVLLCTKLQFQQTGDSKAASGAAVELTGGVLRALSAGVLDICEGTGVMDQGSWKGGTGQEGPCAWRGVTWSSSNTKAATHFNTGP